MERLRQDIRYGFRMLLKQPIVSFVAILSLGLGIGANTTIFTIVHAVLLTPVPVADLSTLARVYTLEWEFPDLMTGVSYRNYEDLRDNNTMFEALAAYARTSVNLIPDGSNPRQIAAQFVTSNYFGVLGIEPFLGRDFLPEEEEREVAAAILSYGLWERQFESDPEVVGSEINLGNRPVTVIGVAPRHFKGLESLGEPDLVWLPMGIRRQMMTGLLGRYFELRRARFAQIVGRLKEGVSFEQAHEQIHAIGLRLEQEYPDVNRGREAVVRPFSSVNPNQQARYEQAGGLVAAVVGIVLLLACVNVANLLLARAADREKEISIRVALGAGRRRLVRQLLTESLVLALLGGVTGLALAYWGRDLMWAYRPPFLGQHDIDLSLNPVVLLFTLAIALTTGLLFGLVPALETSKIDLRESLHQAGRSSGSAGNRRLLRKLLVVTEVALAIVSLVGAGLFVRSMGKVGQVDPGFEDERLLLLRLNIGNAGYAPADGKRFYVDLLQRLEALPGVRGVSLSSGRLLGGGIAHTTYPEGVDIAEGRGRHVNDIVVTPGYFSTVGADLRQGRLLNAFDRDGDQRVAVINEATRKLFWPDVDPLGRRFTRSVEDFDIEVVGVVEDVLIDIMRPPQPVIYTVLDQFYQSAVQVQVRTAGQPAQMAGAVQREIQDLDPSLPVSDLVTVADSLEEALWAPRMGSVLLGVFGLLALVLAAVGIYGVMSCTVRERRHEIGLRMAFGAPRPHVVGLILSQGMALVAVGILVGAFAAAAITRLIQSMLFGVSTIDPLTYMTVSLILAAVALIAVLVPALRLLRVDPLEVIRYEN